MTDETAMQISAMLLEILKLENIIMIRIFMYKPIISINRQEKKKYHLISVNVPFLKITLPK